MTRLLRIFCGTGLFAATLPAAASPFASQVVEATGYGTPGLYTTPAAVLGKPTTQFYDAWEDQVFRTSAISAPFGTAPDGTTPLITTISNTQSITVTFDQNVENDPKNPFGVDLLVFGNSFFTGSAFVTPETNPSAVSILGGANSEPVTVSVAQSLSGPWYTFAGTGDGLFPTQGYRLNGNNWAAESDFTRPVNPAYTDATFENLTLTEAVALYDGSGGGAGFDLALSGFEWIRYVRLTGNGGEVDAIADVSPIPEPSSLAVVLSGAAGLLLRRRGRRFA